MNRRILLALLLLGLGGLGYWLLADAYYLRYRLTIDIEADGKLHSASSVIEVRYWWTTFSSGGKGWAARVDSGLAPIIDLGRYGTVLVPLGTDVLVGRLTQSNHSLRLSGTELAGLPYLAFGHQMPDVYRVRGKVVLDQRQYPPLIWVPPDHDWRNAKQLWSEELGAFAGNGIKVVQMTVETAPGAETMVVPNPVPPALSSLCTPEYEKLSARSFVRAGEPFYIRPNNIGEKYEYRPFRLLSVCKLIAKRGT